MEIAEFCAAVNQYQELRERERAELIDYLSKHENIKRMGVRVNKGGGKGKRGYTSGKRIAPYDLSNWKWVELTGPEFGFNCVISFNMTEVDPASGNTHCLYDRIGIYITYQQDGHYYKTDIYTNIDLPLDDSKKEELAGLILKQYRFVNGNSNDEHT